MTGIHSGQRGPFRQDFGLIGLESRGSDCSMGMSFRGKGRSSVLYYVLAVYAAFSCNTRRKYTSAGLSPDSLQPALRKVIEDLCVEPGTAGRGSRLAERSAESVNVHQKQGEVVMSMVKVIEIIAESKKSWDAAAENAVKEASKSVRDIKSLYVQEMQAIVEDGKITKYRMNAKISFVVE